jgi:hypothetical protein
MAGVNMKIISSMFNLIAGLARYMEIKNVSEETTPVWSKSTLKQ